MKTTVDALLIEEARAGALRFRCDDCVHYDDARIACAHGFPVAPHRPGPLVAGSVIVFCKEFELFGGGGDR